MDWPVPPTLPTGPKMTVPVPGVKVPLLVQLPPTVILLLPAERPPAVIVRLLATDIAPDRENKLATLVTVNVPLEVNVLTVV